MFCKKCGTELKPNAAFCYRCGTKVSVPAPKPVNTEVTAPANDYIKTERIEETEPVASPEPAVSVEPAAVTEPVAVPEPDVTPEPVMAAEPVEEQEFVAFPEPDVTPEPAMAAEPADDQEFVAFPEPDVTPEPAMAAEPAETPVPVVIPAAAVAAGASNTPAPAITPSPVPLAEMPDAYFKGTPNIRYIPMPEVDVKSIPKWKGFGVVLLTTLLAAIAIVTLLTIWYMSFPVIHMEDYVEFKTHEENDGISVTSVFDSDRFVEENNNVPEITDAYYKLTEYAYGMDREDIDLIVETVGPAGLLHKDLMTAGRIDPNSGLEPGDKVKFTWKFNYPWEQPYIQIMSVACFKTRVTYKNVVFKVK